MHRPRVFASGRDFLRENFKEKVRPLSARKIPVIRNRNVCVQEAILSGIRVVRGLPIRRFSLNAQVHFR